ncbi:MAG: sulfur carrier protein ThiS [Nibricoccus sp.]
MTIRVNDKPQAVAEQATLHDLLDELGHTGKRGVAVAVNDAVVTRSGWTDRRLVDGDRVLIIQATQGG